MLDIVETTAARIVVTGHVQGVGFRYFTSDLAERLGITGWVKNLPDGRVEVDAQGQRETITMMIDRLLHGPPRSSVDNVDVTWRAERVRDDPAPIFQIVP